MATTVQSILNQAYKILFDEDRATPRWDDATLVGYASSGQLEAVILKPEVNAKTSVVQMASGTKQSLPADAVSIIDFVRNMGADGSTPGRAIRVSSRDILDATSPDWHAETQAALVKNAMYDLRNPKSYYVYPPQNGTARIEIVYSSIPASLTIGGNVSISDEYANCLVDYVCFRAFWQDNEVSSAQKSIAHYQQFANALGVKLQNNIANNPNVRNAPFNPAVPAAAQ